MRYQLGRLVVRASIGVHCCLTRILEGKRGLTLRCTHEWIPKISNLIVLGSVRAEPVEAILLSDPFDKLRANGKALEVGTFHAPPTLWANLGLSHLYTDWIPAYAGTTLCCLWWKLRHSPLLGSIPLGMMASNRGRTRALMRNQEQFLTAYAQSHRNAVNQIIHCICVPVIALATLALLWPIPIGRWLGLSEPAATWVNLVTILGIPILWFYARMSSSSLFTMAVWYAISLFVIVVVQQTFGTTTLVVAAAISWIGAWVLQFYGHEVEGARPSFVEDLVFLLIGPLFVMDKLYKKMGMRGL